MSVRHPNYSIHTIHVSQIDQDALQPSEGWKVDVLDSEEDLETSRDEYLDITDMSDRLEIDDRIESGRYMINSLGWMISKTGPFDEAIGDRKWRRLRGTKIQGYTSFTLSNTPGVSYYLQRRNAHHLVIVGFGDQDKTPHECPVDHFDRDRSNNNIHNLRYLSVQENVKHSQIGNHSGNLQVNNTSSETGVLRRPNGNWACQLRVDGKLHYKGFRKLDYDPDTIPPQVKTCIREWRERYLGDKGPLQLHLGNVVSDFDDPDKRGIIVDIYPFHDRNPDRIFRVGYPDTTKDCAERSHGSP